MKQSATSNLLDASAVSRGEALGILARSTVEGYIVGEHRSPFRGFAIEFAQHREYAPGDDTRHIDWKVLGRCDRYTIKQYEQDTNFVANMILDSSESMDYGSGKITKFDYCRQLAACFCYLVLIQRDAVALELSSTEVRSTFPRTDNVGKFHDLAHMLAAVQPAGNTNLGQAIQDLAGRNRRRGLVFIFSDFFADEEAVRHGLQHLQFTGQDVIVFHVMDPAELSFDFRGSYQFVGLEGEGIIETNPADIRKSYLQEVKAFKDRIREITERAGAHYVFASTREPLAETVSGYLAFRHRVTAR